MLSTEKSGGSGEKLKDNLPGLVGMFDAGNEGGMLAPPTMTIRLALEDHMCSIAYISLGSWAILAIRVIPKSLIAVSQALWRH
jgi:hypothetical protein